MIRCAKCHSPNPDQSAFCARCGSALVFEKRPLIRKKDWISLVAAKKALKGALFFTLLMACVAGEFMNSVAARSELELAILFALFGMGLAFFGTWKRSWLVLALGLAGGLLAYSLDFFYNYEHLFYKAVWWVVSFLAPSNDNRAAETAYGLLQALRFLGLATPLLMVMLWKREGVRLFKALLLFVAAECLVFHVRGAFLRFSFSADFAVHFFLYFTAVFLFYYGSDHLDENPAK